MYPPKSPTDRPVPDPTQTPGRPSSHFLCTPSRAPVSSAQEMVHSRVQVCSSGTAAAPEVRSEGSRTLAKGSDCKPPVSRREFLKRVQSRIKWTFPYLSTRKRRQRQERKQKSPSSLRCSSRSGRFCGDTTSNGQRQLFIFFRGRQNRSPNHTTT
ncbi:hypothetical protein L596_001831 [Steinernema carpocapsae]|uniref:Uncharacterized protein n=1 Tax=Steinernema carpocapsae TaxID=34508 RepID=A0A4U8UMM6_STECR|nr:hypothetical protein L596_001831 [Steinernema carpocapsae]